MLNAIQPAAATISAMTCRMLGMTVAPQLGWDCIGSAGQDDGKVGIRGCHADPRHVALEHPENHTPEFGAGKHVEPSCRLTATAA